MAVAKRAGDHQGLFIVDDCLGWFAQVIVGQAQVAEVEAFSEAVASLAGDRQGLLEVSDGGGELAQASVSNTQNAKRDAFAITVAQAACGRSYTFPQRDALMAWIMAKFPDTTCHQSEIDQQLVALW